MAQRQPTGPARALLAVHRQRPLKASIAWQMNGILGWPPLQQV